MGGYLGVLRPVGQPRNRREDAVWRDDVDLFQIRDWKTAAGRENVGSEKFEEATAPERAGSPDEQEQKFLSQFNIILFVKFRPLNLVVLFVEQGVAVVFEYANNQPLKNTSLDTILLKMYHQRHVSAS
jgi:hypothetical protein